MYRREATIRYFLQQKVPREDAEDLTQEVQIRLWLASLRGIETVDALWRCVCRSVLYDYLRRLRRERALFVYWEELPLYSTSSYVPACPSFVDECLSFLSDEQQTLVRLHILEGMTFAEIASRLGVTAGAVQKRYQRAVSHLRQHRLAD